MTEIPVWEKAFLNLDEASAYFNLGVNKIRNMTSGEDCPHVLWNGTKRLIKRKTFEEFLTSSYSI